MVFLDWLLSPTLLKPCAEEKTQGEQSAAKADQWGRGDEEELAVDSGHLVVGREH